MCGPKGELTVQPSLVSIVSYETLRAQYNIQKTIGHGSCAQVKLAHHRLTGAAVAIKVLPKGKMQDFPIMSEVGILKKVDHPNIVSLVQVIETEENVFLILELADGCRLLDWIQQDGYLKEDVARKIFTQIVDAMCYCHERGIVHRDLKPDNIMVDATGKVKIIDFGLGALVRPGKKLYRFCGALRFNAPEFFRSRPYDGTKVDTWILGVLLYFMVTGTLPFDGSTYKELEDKVLVGQYKNPSHLSQELQDIIHCLLTVNPKKRPTMKDIMQHPWLKIGDEASPSHYDKMNPCCLDRDIVATMADMGFDPSNIRKSLFYRLFNEPMATYCLLQCQARKQSGSSNQTKAVQPGTTSFPTPSDAATVSWCQKRTTAKPAIQRTTAKPAIRVSLSLASKTVSAEESQQVGQGPRRGASVPLTDPPALQVSAEDSQQVEGSRRGASVPLTDPPALQVSAEDSQQVERPRRGASVPLTDPPALQVSAEDSQEVEGSRRGASVPLTDPPALQVSVSAEDSQQVERPRRSVSVPLTDPPALQISAEDSQQVERPRRSVSVPLTDPPALQISAEDSQQVERPRRSASVPLIDPPALQVSVSAEDSQQVERPRRSASVPLIDPPALHVSAEDSQQVGQGPRRSASVPLIDPRYSQKRTPTHDSVRNPTGTHHSRTGDKIRRAYRGWKRWASRIGAGLLQTFCCVPRKSRRVSPQCGV